MLWAENSTDRAEYATPQEIARHIDFMHSTLPSRLIDQETGAKRTAVYIRLLSGYSNDALTYMAREVLRTCKWFPTPSECLEILKGYRAPPTVRDQALALCHRWSADKYDAWVASLKAGETDQADIDGAPDRWKRIAVEQCLLRRMDDGRHVLRLRQVAGAAQ